MQEFRDSKPDDQENVQKAISYIHEMYKNHPEIESTLWCAALVACLVRGYVMAGLSHKDFCEELEIIKNYYKDEFREK